jgi:threonine synthase
VLLLVSDDPDAPKAPQLSFFFHRFSYLFFIKEFFMNKESCMQTTIDTIANYYEFDSPAYSYGEITTFPNVEIGQKGLDKWLPLLPIKEFSVHLNGGEGNTPLEQCPVLGNQVGLSHLFVKHEECNPTGCFKDRESAVVISKAMELGKKKVNVCSSGNAAVSTAAYAQKAGIDCTCFIPEKTSEGKKQLIALYGATIVEIPGFYEDVYRHLVDTHPDGWNVTSGQNMYRTEGNKTIAYELWEQLHGVPDVVVVPCGNGGCLAGIWKGFTELQQLGKIQTLPQMVAVQVKGAAPLAASVEQGKTFTVLGAIDDSIAEGIVAQESYCSPKAVSALQSSGGYVVEVTDDEIKAALKLVIQTQSLVPEPTSAAVYAALPKLSCDKDATVVAINTGSGMKVLTEILDLIGAPTQEMQHQGDIYQHFGEDGGAL